jgi:hypothetical protein
MGAEVIDEAKKGLELFHVDRERKVEYLTDLFITHRDAIFRNNASTEFDLRETEFAFGRFAEQVVFGKSFEDLFKSCKEGFVVSGMYDTII